MELESILEVMGVDLGTLSQINENGLNLYTQFGKHPIASLRLDGSKFVLRFGDAVQPTSMCEELPTGVIRVSPIELKVE